MAVHYESTGFDGHTAAMVDEVGRKSTCNKNMMHDVSQPTVGNRNSQVRFCIGALI